MILQELYALYGRLMADPSRNIPRLGFSSQGISFCITIKKDGTLIAIDSLRYTDPIAKNPKSSSIQMLVLGGSKPSGSGLNPCFLWDNCGYLLGFKGDDDPKKERTLEAFSALKSKYLSVEKSVANPSFSAVCRFLESWDTDKTRDYIADKDLLLGNGVFKVQSDQVYVHEIPEIRNWWLEVGNNLWSGKKSGGTDRLGMCLISGKEQELALLHDPAIKGVRDAQMSGAKLVSFNCNAFISYGKEQSINAPVGEAAAFAYCNALNYLISRPENRIQIGGATTVFWTDAPASKADEKDELLKGLIDPPVAMDKGVNDRLRDILELMAKGNFSSDVLEDASTRFFILGMEANASRLSVPFWYESTLKDFADAVQKHYQDLSIQKQWDEKSKHPDPSCPRPFDLLRQTARESKDICKPFVGSLMRSILFGHRYSNAMAHSILARMRIDHDVNYYRCSFLKAWLLRLPDNKYTTITPMLDLTNNAPGYLLGRLFAVYEKTQRDANPDRELNATIADNYFARASMTPLVVFSTLFRLNGHHLEKLEVGARTNRKKLIGEIVDGLPSVPSHLNLEQQAFFGLGYYQQMKDLYTSKKDKDNKQEQ